MSPSRTLVPFVLVLALLAVTCSSDDGSDPAETACRKLFDLCGNTWFDGNIDKCVQSLDPKGDCRLSCTTDEAKTCSQAESCLFGQLGSGEFVDQHCSPVGTKGVCYFQYNDGTTSGFGCLNEIYSREYCEAWVLDRTLDGASLIQWDWLTECASAGCSGTCGPDWWSPY